MLGSKTPLGGQTEGRLSAWRCIRTGDRPIPAVAETWNLPGAPVDAVALAGGRVAVLTRAAGRPLSYLLLLDVTTRGAPHAVTAHADLAMTPGFDAQALSASANSDTLFVLSSGYRLNAAGGEAGSQLVMLRGEELKPEGEAVPLRGVPLLDGPTLITGPDGACWCLTRVPGTEFGYAACVRLNAQGLPAKTTEYPLPVASASPRLAVSPSGADVAVAVGNRLEIWADGKRGGPAYDFESDIRALTWRAAGLFVGEGCRIHCVAPEPRAPLQTLAVQSGRIEGFAFVPPENLPADDPDADGLSGIEEQALKTDPNQPDTDNDGLPDGSDPEPVTPSPALRMPEEIMFHGAAAGREIRVLDLRTEHGAAAWWTVGLSREGADRFVITPMTGRVPGQIYIALNPAVYHEGEAFRTRLTVCLDGAQPGAEAFGSPAAVDLRILPSSQGPRRVLWLCESAEQEGTFNALRSLLSGPPLLLSHATSVQPFTESLHDYAIVAISAEAAARGVLVRQDLLDYIAGGGALLFLGEYLGDAGTRPLAHWLSPLGVSIDTSARVDRAAATRAATPDELTRHWDRVPISGGCALSTSGILIADPEAPGNALFATSEYGYGRVALLAAATPLEDDALRQSEARLLALDLFAWLDRAGANIRDMDGDGLRDETEDANDNGSWDPVETNYVAADTDDDGIPDGAEDANRNGAVDDGESDPRNRDSDGDGIFDGADRVPCAAIGAPVVVSVEGLRGVAEGPAEGGTPLVLQGRNFAQDSAVWFGDRPAESVRVYDSRTAAVVSPACARPEGGVVDIRVVAPRPEAPGETLEGTLPGAFRYTPLSKAELRLSSAETPAQTAQGFTGSIRVDLAMSDGVTAGMAAFVLIPDPADTDIAWQLGKDPEHPDSAPRMILRSLGKGMLLVHTTPEHAFGAAGLVGYLDWRLDATEKAPARLRIEPARVIVTSPNGVALDSSGEGLRIDLGPEPPAPTRADE